MNTGQALLFIVVGGGVALWRVGRVIEREPGLVIVIIVIVVRATLSWVRSAKVRCLIDAWPCYLVKVGHLIDATALQLDGLGQLHPYPLGYRLTSTQMGTANLYS